MPGQLAQWNRRIILEPHDLYDGCISGETHTVGDIPVSMASFSEAGCVKKITVGQDFMQVRMSLTVEMCEESRFYLSTCR